MPIKNLVAGRSIKLTFLSKPWQVCASHLPAAPVYSFAVLMPQSGICKNLLEDYVVTGQFHSHLSPKLEARPFPEKGGWGVFARKSIKKGELLVL